MAAQPATSSSARPHWSQQVACWGALVAVLTLLLCYVLWERVAFDAQDAQTAWQDGRRAHVNLITGAITLSEPAPLPQEAPEPAATPQDTSTPEPATEDAPAATPPETKVETKVEPTAAPVSHAVNPAALEGEKLPINAASYAGIPLLVAPAEKLSEKSPHGILPIIAPDGATSWQYYAKPFDASTATPRIALVVVGLGVNKSANDQATRLQDSVALSFSPYAPESAAWVKSSRLLGHEALLDLPSEPSQYPADDPGPLGLISNIPVKDNMERLQQVMGAFSGYVGLVIAPNERFTSNRDAFFPILKEFNRRGLMLVFSNPPDRTTEEMLRQNNTVYLVADRVIDTKLNSIDINASLKGLEESAKRTGGAVGVLRTYPISMRLVQQWAESLPERGLELAPPSAIAMQRFGK